MITFCPYFAHQFGIHEAIVYEIFKEELKHAYIYKYGKFWVKLNRFTWINQLFFIKEYEFEQALENMIKYKILQFKEEMYSINEDFCYRRD